MPGKKVPFLQHPGRSDPKVPRCCGNLGLLCRGLCDGSNMLHLSETASGGGSGTVPQDQDSWLVSLLLHAPLCAPSLCHVWLGASVPLFTEADGGILQRQGLRSSGGKIQWIFLSGKSPAPCGSTLAPLCWGRSCSGLKVAFMGSAQAKGVGSKSRISWAPPARCWSEPALPPQQRCLCTVLGPLWLGLSSKHLP